MSRTYVWFAWRPVKTGGGKWLWWKPVWRNKTRFGGMTFNIYCDLDEMRLRRPDEYRRVTSA